MPVIEKDSTAHQERRVVRARSSRCRSARNTATCIKLIPGVQYTQDATRGPSAGGSGQDNVYKFDGVNVTLPLFGTLSAEPASHDIAQVTTVKGGAKAVDFDRAGGFTVDSVSKSGTNRYSGQVSYQFQNSRHGGRRARAGSALEVRAGPDAGYGQPRRAGHPEQAVLLRVVLPARRETATTRRTCTASCPTTRASATRASAS